MSQMLDRASVVSLIQEGKPLLLAADETLLADLPQGNWIGGTIPYFMADKGGVTTTDKIFVTPMPDYAKVSIRRYTVETLPSLALDHPGHGFTVLLIPAFSQAHATFAKDVSNYQKIYDRPVVGWISGVALADIGRITPKIFDGATSGPSDTDAVAMHVELPAGYEASVDIVNLFRQGEGATITFKDAGFSASVAEIDGSSTSLADYIAKNQIDTKLPLVANYNGAMINVSIQAIDEAKGTVSFYAPVFPGISYRFAAPVADYEGGFAAEMSDDGTAITFGCNCVLNYFYAGLEGHQTGRLTGPMTFGEIAYMLLNQTAVYLTVEKTA